MKYTVKDILRMEVAPALGCTEPVAIALGAAAATSLLPDREIDSVEIWVDPNIYKNGIAVFIPGTGGLSGLDTAAAIGALGGNAEMKLEVLESVDDALTAQVLNFLKSDKVKVNLLPDQKGLYIKTVLHSGADKAESLIRDMHDNITELSLNGVPVKDSPLLSEAKSGGKSDLAEMENCLKKLSLEKLLDLVDDLDDDDLAFLEEGIRHNMRLADFGI